MHAAPDPACVSIGGGLWVDTAALRQVLASRLRRSSKRSTRGRRLPEPPERRERQQLLTRAIANLDAVPPVVDRETRDVLLRGVAFVSGSGSGQPQVVARRTPLIDLGQGRALPADDVRQCLRALGRAYHRAGQHEQAAICRQLVRGTHQDETVELPGWLQEAVCSGLG
jgi:hypothetical protein